MHLTWPARRESSDTTPYILSFNYSSTTRADFSVDRFDLSFPWLFATIAVLFLLDRIRITNVGAQRALKWTGRRSHSIYLLQYTAIAIVAPFAYDTLLAGGISGLVALFRLLVWVGVVVGSYALSLTVASLVDVTLLKLVLAGYDGIAKRVVRWFEAVGQQACYPCCP